MVGGPSGAVVLKHLRALFDMGTATGLADGPLLERFVVHHDETAFEALLARHGPMVLGVCRRVLGDPSDIEDAFQATFLVLVRKAGSLRERELLGSWLYGVAYRVEGLAHVELGLDPPPVVLALQVAEDEDRLDQAAGFLQGACQPVLVRGGRWAAASAATRWHI
jgi:hypothetical protein